MNGRKKDLENKIKVGHDFTEVSEGVDYIMTIKDKNVLDEDELDTLENEILNINKKMKLSEKRDLEKEQDQYLKDQILTKYDENSKAKGFIIANDNKKKKLKNSEIEYDLSLNENIEDSFSKDGIESIKEKLKTLKTQSKVEMSELNFEKKFTTDYLTPEEFKPKEFKRKKIMNNKGIKSLRLEEDENNVTNPNNRTINPYSEQDEHDELHKFLEKQRNLVNKSKEIAPEEKIIKILNSTKTEEINREDSVGNNLPKSNFNETNKKGKYMM
jgi:SART-1 family